MPQINFHYLFPSLIGETTHPEPDPLNDHLLTFIHQLRDQNLGSTQNSTITHGWRSTSDLLEHKRSEITSLRAFFDESIQNYMRQWINLDQVPHKPTHLQHQYKGWAVILSDGGSQQQHVHSRTDLIGVYCVAKPLAPNKAVGGELTLIDPRPGKLSTRLSWESEIISLPVMPGRLYLIPSFIAHRVESVLVPGERVTINFDILITTRS